MLTITLPQTDEYEALTLRFEHSLFSLSKWEAIHKRPFFGNKEMTPEETVSYISEMLLDEIPPEGFLHRFEKEHYTQITDYIHDRHSATWFNEPPDNKKRGPGEVITAELMYYWLVQFNIPFEVQHWHLANLMNLVKIAGIKQSKPKKMSKKDQMEQYRALNAQRREQLGTQG